MKKVSLVGLGGVLEKLTVEEAHHVVNELYAVFDILALKRSEYIDTGDKSLSFSISGEIPVYYG